MVQTGPLSLLASAELRPATTAEIDALWRDCWGLPIVTPWHQYLPPDARGLVAVVPDRIVGLVTWALDGPVAEIVTLDAFEEGRGIGTRLMAAAEAAIAALGASCIRLVTTGDNASAITFYIRRGYRLVGVRLDEMDRVRAVKPSVSLVGMHGLPLRDVIDFIKELGA